VKEYYDRVTIVYIHDENVYGTVEKMGAFASQVKYQKDDIDYMVLIENDEFAIVEEIVFQHFEEEN
jgi:hypothetical protein